jgi:hypothetical protein
VVSSPALAPMLLANPDSSRSWRLDIGPLVNPGPEYPRWPACDVAGRFRPEVKDGDGTLLLLSSRGNGPFLLLFQQWCAIAAIGIWP